MIEVINHRDWDGGEGIYVGRPSVFGNPYVIGRHGTRQQVIEMYRVWLRDRWIEGGPAKKELLKLARRHVAGERLIFVCWCSPAPCHAEVIKEAVEKISEKVLDRPHRGGKVEHSL